MGCAIASSHANPLKRLRAIKVKRCMKKEKQKSKRIVLSFVSQRTIKKKNSLTISTDS